MAIAKVGTTEGEVWEVIRSITSESEVVECKALENELRDG